MDGDDCDDNDKSKMTQRRPTQVPSDGKDMNNFSSSLDEAAAAGGMTQAATKGAAVVCMSGAYKIDLSPSFTSHARAPDPAVFVPGLGSQTRSVVWSLSSSGADWRRGGIGGGFRSGGKGRVGLG